MASGVIHPPGQTPEDPYARDARIAIENEKARRARDEQLQKTEAENALRVHLPVALVDEAAQYGMEFVLAEPDDETPGE